MFLSSSSVDELSESLFANNTEIEGIDLSKEEKEILIEICEASDLQLRKMIMRPNPFVKCFIKKDQIFKTKINPSTLNPQWFESEKFLYFFFFEFNFKMIIFI